VDINSVPETVVEEPDGGRL